MWVEGAGAGGGSCSFGGDAVQQGGVEEGGKGGQEGYSGTRYLVNAIVLKKIQLQKIWLDLKHTKHEKSAKCVCVCVFF